MEIRNYNPKTDYEAVATLYKSSETFGGQYDDVRNAEDRMKILVDQKPDAILVAENNGKIVGTVTLFEDGRSAWLYRFAMQAEDEGEIVNLLNEQSLSTLKQKRHSQVLVYAPTNNKHFENRYISLSFNKGNDFTAYWQDI